MKKVFILLSVVVVVMAGTAVIYYGIGSGQEGTSHVPDETAGAKEQSPPKSQEHKKVSLSQIPEPEGPHEEVKKFNQWLMQGDVERIEALVELCAEEGTDDHHFRMLGGLGGVIRNVRSLARRRKLIEFLLKGLLDQRYSSHHDYIERMGFKRHLDVLYEEDFTPKAENMLAKIIEERGLTYTRVMLTGIADMERYYPRYRKMARAYLNGEKKEGTSWAAVLVMARCGKQEAREKFARGACQDVQEKELIRVIDLLGDLAYTRHPVAIRCIREYLNSDEEIGSGGRGLRNREINSFASRVLQATLRNYPTTGEDRPWKERSRQEREWMNTHSGQWEFYTSASQWPGKAPWLFNL